MRLTSLYIENAKPTAARQEILDRDGLYFVIQPSGHKSWCLRYRRKTDSKSIKHTIGDYPMYSLKDARAKANELRAEIERGGDPHGDKVAKRRSDGDTFEDAARRYIEDIKHDNRSWKWSARMLGLAPDGSVLPDGSKNRLGHKRVSPADRWGARPVESIVAKDIVSAVDSLGRTIQANRLQAVLSAFFAWARGKHLVALNPCAGLRRTVKERSRERVLSDDELRRVWLAAGELGHPYRGIVQLLILTGQRRSEIAGLRWSEIDPEERLIHLPKERTKNGHAHDVPLSPLALHTIACIPRLVDSDLVFTRHRKPVTAFDWLKDLIDKGSGVTDWTLHDLRRTVASGLQRLGVRLEVTEAVLNHRGGSVSGITAVYQRHSYAEEKRAALARWADHIDGLISGASGKVVALRA
jgi:integrase